MTDIKLITASEIKSLIPEINLEINDLMINNAILMVQQSLIKPSIGEEWYDEFITEKSGGTFSTNNNYIFENYLKWILAYGTWQHISVTLSYQVTSAGLRIKESDHSVPVEPKDIAYYRTFISNYIDNTRNSMHRYIDLHKSDYPLYFNNKYNENPNKVIYNFKISGI